MPTIQFVDFKAVKNAITMLRVLDHYGLTKKFKHSPNGETLTGPCPIHKGENPTQFRISNSKNCWNCFGRCQRGGNILDFVSKMEDCTIRQAAIQICEWFGLDTASQVNRSAKADKSSSDEPVEDGGEKAPAAEVETASKEAAPNKPLGFELKRLSLDHPYFGERNLTPDAISYFSLGYCEHGSMAGRIVIPINNVDGKIVAYAGRWPGEPAGPDNPKYKLPAGFKKSQELFNMDRAAEESDDEPLIIVEGFFDCIKLWQSGFTRTIALMGSSLSAEQESLIRDNTTSETRIVLMLDEDDAGRQARDEIAARLVNGRFVKIIVFADEGSQPEHLSEEDLAELF